MKSIVLYLLFTYTLIAQNSLIDPNLRMPKSINVSILNDTLKIDAKEGVITGLDIIKRVDWASSESTGEIEEYSLNKYRIALLNYPKGTYTIQLSYNRKIYPFKLFRLETIQPYSEKKTPKIIYRYVKYGIVSSFGSSTGEKRVTSNKELQRLLLKFSKDQITKNGKDNWLKVYEVNEYGKHNLIKHIH